MDVSTPANYDGYAALACAIAKARRQEYYKALRALLRSPNDTTNIARVAYWERKLKGPITNLSDEDLATLREQLTRELSPIIAKEKIRIAKINSASS